MERTYEYEYSPYKGVLPDLNPAPDVTVVKKSNLIKTADVSRKNENGLVIGKIISLLVLS